MKRTGGPLEGVKVLDQSDNIAAPYACSLLADLGADVVKIEPPGGDALRSYPSTLAAESRAFIGVNRSKRGIVLDLKQAEGAAALRRLVAEADVLVHNFRPAVPARLGLDYETLRPLNPRLIYCELTGYGATGPRADRAGYDQVLQAVSGICAVQGLGKPAPEIVYGSVVDFYAAALLSNAICAALYRRERTGEGQALGVSLLGAALAMQSARFVWADGEPREIGRDMRSGGITGIYPCAGGTHLYVSANTPHFWAALCGKIGQPALARDPEYDSVRKRAARAADLIPIISEALLKHDAPTWEQLFGDEVPCGAVRAMEDMFDDPQTLDQGFVGHFDHARAGGYRAFTGAFQFSATPDPFAFASPALGEHTEDVLSAAGFSAEEIATVRSKGPSSA